MWDVFIGTLIALAFVVLIIVGVLVLIALVMLIVRGSKSASGDMHGDIVIINVSKRLGDFKDDSEHYLTLETPKKKVTQAKATGVSETNRNVSDKSDSPPERIEKQRLFVLEFNGDISGRQVYNLRQEVSAIITIAKPGDRVLVRIDSSGGRVHTYGLGASQLHRLKLHNLHVTTAVDGVAASGGYMMAVVSDRVICAPFAYIGSIGVMAQMLNVRRLLENLGIDVMIASAGEHKLSMSPLTEVTEEQKKHNEEKVKGIHDLFKKHVSQYRPRLQIDEVAKGDMWLGTEAVEKGLADEVVTSDDEILRLHNEGYRVLQVQYCKRQLWIHEKVRAALVSCAWSVVSHVFEHSIV
jgi:serine protease SohB